MNTETNQSQPVEKSQAKRSKNAPVETLRDGALKVSIFKNEYENGTQFSLEPGRIYTDARGSIRESKSLSGSEPLRMSRLLDKGYDRVGQFKAELKRRDQEAEKEQ